MQLRIVSGLLKGRYIKIPERYVKFRPTQERVRQAVTEAVKNKISGSCVADICAGSGAFGFEMLSRGAESADFVEADKILSQKIKEQAIVFNVESKCRIHREDVRKFVQRCLLYDIIFYDPPYQDEELSLLIPSLINKLSPSGILLYEHNAVDKNMAVPEGFTSETRRYGTTVIDFFLRSR
jgi:16S rRNA (guanine966-N2)-methyltransferase